MMRRDKPQQHSAQIVGTTPDDLSFDLLQKIREPISTTW
jgi:hypothetical protein